MKNIFFKIDFYIRKISQASSMNLLYFIANYNCRKSIMYKIHWYSLKKYLSLESIKTMFYRYIVFLLQPLFLIVSCLYYANKFRRIVNLKYNISLSVLFWDSLSLGFFKNVLPLYYYRYQLYLNENKNQIEYLIFGNESLILLRHLNSSVKLDIVDDKCKFYDICKDNKLKIPHIYGIFANQNSFVDLPEEDLIIKPSRGSKGEGIEIWLYENKKYFNKSMKIESKDLYKHIGEKYAKLKTDLIIQQRIENHSKLKDLSTGALVTVRVVTLRTLQNEIIHLMSVLVIPVGEKMLRHRTMLTPIDEKTGELGLATTYGVISKTFEYHPDTNAQLIGFKVPYWEEVIAMVKESHKYFLDYMSLGWDIAITDEGPVIIEANRIWDVETMQRPHNTPLGTTVFADLCCEIMDKIK